MFVLQIGTNGLSDGQTGSDGVPYEKFEGEDNLNAETQRRRVEVPFNLPPGWAWCKWRDISISVQYGYNAPAIESGRIRMVRITDIQDNSITWNDVPYCQIDDTKTPQYMLHKGDILFARTGSTVGKSILTKDAPFAAVFAGYLVRTQCVSNILPQFAKCFLESSVYWNQLKSGMTATAQPNFNGEKLSSMIFPLPPLAEQKRIVAKIEELRAMTRALTT